MPDSTRPIRFVLDGHPVSVDDVPPSTMLLDWLRTRARATGTKEGCAEGDCGACTVVLARREADGSVRAEPCNACIRPLASVDGCGVLTVEGLGGTHPVQRAMVECHGSQCGFCTPGFVTAMAARLAAGPVADRVQACEALAGNLCRCTGYRPIVDALHAASDALHGHGDAGPAAGLPDWVAALPAAEPTPLAFSAGGVEWVAPRSPEAVDALLAETPDAWLLAGGTDVGLWVTKQLREPRRWIRLGSVDALHRAEAGPDMFEIGAAVSLADAFALLRDDYPELDRYWSRFASPAIRASGTLVGNVANGSPIGDSPPVLIALGATVVLRRAGEGGATRRRELPLQDLYLDYRVQRREPGEWIERLRVPRRRAGQSVIASKLSKRFEQDISAVSLGLSFDGGATLSTVRIAFGGMAGIVKRAVAAEAVLEGAAPTLDAFERAGAAIAADFSPLDDLRASRDYRLAAAAGMLVRAWHARWGAGPVDVEDPALDAMAEGAR
ncbi:MAG: xanthine dehydrogenase small subunit [Burkholderiales bacterium]|jgi:xanthine dehydrogenase small subunit